MTAEQSNFADQATHHVRLVLDNDEGLYHWRRGLVAEALSTADASADESDTTDETLAYAVSALADDLKDGCEELADLGNDAMPMLAREMLTLALAWIDWREMAADYIAEERS